MIKSTRNGYCDHVQDIRNLSARVENSEEFGMGVWLQFGRGEVGWERRRRRNRGKGCRLIGHIMVFTDGFFLSVIPSVMPSVKVPRHCTAITV